MALIGTISGSNGTTTSAVTGSLIIAADPSVITPVRPTDVVLYVSGAATTLGADQPSILFKGDSFVSGALGTDSYIQMKPVGNLRIPTNTTASYIYTSGSTNDLYFTQYSGPYTNTTRLRWLEGMLTTGLFHGGVLSTATGSTTFSITSGSGIILSYNAALTTDPYPTINYVQWPAYISQSLTYVTSSLITYIGINPTGGIIQQTSPFTLTTDSDYITIGRVLHQSGSVTNGVSTQPNVSYGNNHWQDDFMRAFGPLKVSGHILAASGSTLGITKTAGDSYVIGKNYTTDPNNPNNITSASDTAVTVSKIYRAYVSGSTLRLDTGVNNAGYTTINPAQYNNNGTLASVGASDASIQRVYWYPNTASRAFTVYYGSAVYADPPGGTNALDVAQQNIASENFVEGENTAGAAILVGYILAVGNATNLSNTAQARFIQAGVSRGAGAGGGGGVAVGATTAAGLDTYVQFNDGGSTFGGDAGLTYNKTTDTLTIAGDLAVDGGDLTTTAATFNLVTGSATTVNFAQSATTLSVGKAGGSTNVAGNLTGSFVFIGENLTIGGPSQADILTTKTTANLYNTVATTVNIAGAATSVNIGSSGGSTTISGNVTGSNVLLNGDLAVNGGDITTSAATFNLVTGSATTVNFAQNATTLNVGKAGGSSTISGNLTGSFVLIGENLTIAGPTQADILTSKATATLYNTVATTINIGGAANTISIAKAGASTNIQGNLTSSNLAVNGGNITSTAGTLNIASTANVTNLYGSNLLLGATGNVNLSGSATIINAGSSGLSLQRDGSTFSTVTGDATTISLGATPGRTTANIFNSNVSTMNIGGAATTVNIGSGSGRTSVLNDLVLGTGNILVTNDATPITLISSGNIVSKLDINNNATGHKFDIQDWRGVSQFFVGEDGNAELSGSIVVSGSTTMGATIERLTHYQSTGSVIAFNVATDSIFYVNNPTADITANFTGLSSILNNRIVTPTVILSQSATGRIVSALQIDGTSQTINWANGVTPSATANKQDVYGFSLIRSGSAWKVLGQLSTYG
jgi:hypothetical protein